MTLYLLNGGETVPLPVRPLVIRVQSGGGTAAHRLVASAADSTSPVVALERHGMLVLPRIAGPVTVRLLPQPGLQLFAPQSVLTVLLGPDGGDPNADYVQLTVDVSGLPSAELVTLEPVGTSIVVTALGRRTDPALPPHAELARDVARELLGQAYVTGDQAVDLVIGIDCSPSARWAVDDGLLEAILETFAGIASVVDPNGEVEAVLCGRDARRLRPEAIDTFARSTVAAVARQPLVTGLRSRAFGPPAPATLTYLVTDAPPADFAGGAEAPHLVLLTQLAASRTSSPVPYAATAIRPRTASGEGTLWDRYEARDIVASLLARYRKAQEVRR